MKTPVTKRLDSDETEAAPRDVVDGGDALLVGWSEQPPDAALAGELERRGFAPQVLHTADLQEVPGILRTGLVRLLVFGPECPAAATVQCLLGLGPEHLLMEPSVVLIGPYEGVDLMSLVQEERLFFHCPRPLDETRAVALLAGGFAHSRDQGLIDATLVGRSKDRRIVEDRSLHVADETLRNLGARGGDLGSLEDPLLEALTEVLDVDGGRLWVYDSVGHSLRAPADDDPEVAAVAGLTAFAARTGGVVRADEARRDSRFDTDADAPDAGPFYAVPMLGADRRVTGVLSLWRRPGAVPFDDAEGLLIERFAARVAPHLELLGPHPTAERRRRAARRTGVAEIFRDRALDAHERDFTETGRILRRSPGWTRWTWAFLLLSTVLATIFAATVSIDDYADGAAVLREDRVVALIPAAAAADVRADQTATLILDGRPGPVLDLPTLRIDERLIGADAARRRLGEDGAAGFVVPPSSLWVEAPLPDGIDRSAWRPGSTGRLRILVDRKPILFHLMPGLAPSSADGGSP